jgi:hypothetical protein
LIKAIVTLLADLEKTTEGQAIMEPSETERFIEVSAEWEPKLARIRAMYDLIQSR